MRKEVVMMHDESTNEKISLDKHAWRPWVVCFVASLFFFYEFIQMNILNAISSDILNAFSLDAVQMGSLSAMYFIANVLFIIPAGIILDRVSTRAVLIIALIVCITGTAFFAMSSSLSVAKMCRFLIGIGGGFCFLSCVKLASRWFPPKRMAIVTGLVVTMAMLGGMVAQTPMAILSSHYGWRHAMMLDAGLGAVILLLIITFVRDYPSSLIGKKQAHREKIKAFGFWSSAQVAFLNYRNWLCGLYTCLLNLPIFILGGLWGVMYLDKVHHIDRVQASVITSMLFFGTVFGSPIMGWFSDRMGLRRLPMKIGAVASLAIIILMMSFSNLPFAVLLLLFLGLGFFTSAQVVSYPIVAESNNPLLTAMCVSVISISVVSGGAIFNPLFGWLMQKHWNGALIHGLPYYSAGDFQYATWLFPIAFVAGLVALFFIKETHCKHQVEESEGL